MLRNEDTYRARQCNGAMGAICIDLQSVTPVDLLHEVAEGYATLNSYFPEPKPNQWLDIDIGTFRPNADGMTIGHCHL